jgi:hypothetical protein
VARRVLVTGPDKTFDLVEVRAESENQLQEIVKKNPQLVPADDLGLDGPLLVVGRETNLPSGSVDLLCLARSGDLVIVEFKTGPMNPDFRHALAQAIDYGSDLWNLSSISEFDQGVVQRYLSSDRVDNHFRGCRDLRAAVARTNWDLNQDAWEALALRLEQVLATGDFIFVIAAQKFTPTMVTSLEYLNATMRFGKFYLVEVIRLLGSDLSAYAARVVAAPSKSSTTSGTAAAGANEADFLAAILDPEYREAMRDLLASARTLGLVVQWYTKGASIRLRTPNRNEPLSIGWVFLEGGQWYGARHVTLGADDGSLNSTPSVAVAVQTFRDEVKAIPGAQPVPGKLEAYTFLPATFPAAKARVLQALEHLVSATSELTA